MFCQDCGCRIPELPCQICAANFVEDPVVEARLDIPNEHWVNLMKRFLAYTLKLDKGDVRRVRLVVEP